MANNSSIFLVDHCNTSSRCITESATATHDFEVACYPLIDGMGVGEVVTSNNFSAGGYDWQIKFYPDGQNKDCAGNASVYLCCLSRAKNLRTKYTLNVLEKQCKVQVTNFGLIDIKFSRRHHCWGYTKFVEKSKLKSVSDLNNGCFTIRCVLTVIKEPRMEAGKKNLIMVPQPNLQDQLRRMWKDGEGGDVVTLSVSGELFNAHRSLLAARSPVFKAELFGAMKEKATQCIKIDGVESAIFEELLHFIYTDAMLEEDDYKEGGTAKLQHLLVAADRYGVERLKIICESKLCERIDVETVATTLVLAEQHHCRDLRQACIEFTTSLRMLGPVLATDGFKHLEESCPLLMKDILLEVAQGQARTTSPRSRRKKKRDSRSRARRVVFAVSALVVASSVAFIVKCQNDYSRITGGGNEDSRAWLLGLGCISKLKRVWSRGLGLGN